MIARRRDAALYGRPEARRYRLPVCGHRWDGAWLHRRTRDRWRLVGSGQRGRQFVDEVLPGLSLDWGHEFPALSGFKELAAFLRA